MNLTEAAQTNLLKLREDSTIDQILTKLSDCGTTVVLGGAVRDWFFGKQPRDVDIVVDCPVDKLEFLLRFKAKKNKFGGFKLSAGKTEFDIWSLDSTWAFGNDPKLERKLEIVPETVFLNLDAITYCLKTGAILDKGFTQAMESRTLDIVYEPNPYPYLCVSKALIALSKYDLKPSERLKEFIGNQEGRGYSEASFNKYQNVNYGDVIYKYQDCIKRL